MRVSNFDALKQLILLEDFLMDVVIWINNGDKKVSVKNLRNSVASQSLISKGFYHLIMHLL